MCCRCWLGLQYFYSILRLRELISVRGSLCVSLASSRCSHSTTIMARWHTSAVHSDFLPRPLSEQRLPFVSPRALRFYCACSSFVRAGLGSVRRLAALHTQTRQLMTIPTIYHLPHISAAQTCSRVNYPNQS